MEGTLSRSLGDPVARVRVNWTRTQKEGWRLNEMTIEVSNITDDSEAWAKDLMWRQAVDWYENGCQEADRRNEIERGVEAA